MKISLAGCWKALARVINETIKKHGGVDWVWGKGRHRTSGHFKLLHESILRVGGHILTFIIKVAKHDHTSVGLAQGKVQEPCGQARELSNLQLDVLEHVKRAIGRSVRAVLESLISKGRCFDAARN